MADELMPMAIKVPRLRARSRRYKIKRLRKTQGNKCYWCRIEMTPAKKKGDGNPTKTALTLEHKIPLAMGGGNNDGNLVLACYSCNNKKGNNVEFSWSGWDEP